MTARRRLPFVRTYRIALARLASEGSSSDSDGTPLMVPVAFFVGLWWWRKGVPETEITWYLPRNLDDIDIQSLKHDVPDPDEPEAD